MRLVIPEAVRAVLETRHVLDSDLARVVVDQPQGHRYLLPDVCLSGGRFLDGTTVADLPRPVEVLPTHGTALRRALDPTWSPADPLRQPAPAGSPR